MNLFKNAKVGQRIVMFTKSSNGKLIASVLPTTTTISAVVIGQNSYLNATVLGWKDGEPWPDGDNLSSYLVAISANWQKKGIVRALAYTDQCQCELGEENALDIPAVLMPIKKNYGNECPCGIHPNQCHYHKP